MLRQRQDDTALLCTGHPVVLCTDDSGVFQTTLSKEYAIAAQAFKLSNQDLWDLVIKSVDYTFLQEGKKTLLREHIAHCMHANTRKETGAVQ